MDLVLDNQTKSYAVQNYRQDIDGLRAVAVLLVILFHAGLSYFPSGFIGVDIFFTISGFLITGKVISEIERGTFSLTNFIKGRLWRLQPALLVTILGAIIVATYCYMPDDYTAFAKVPNTPLFSYQTSILISLVQHMHLLTLITSCFCIHGRWQLNGSGIFLCDFRDHFDTTGQ